MFAQRDAFVFAAEQAAPLQFGNDAVDEVAEAAFAGSLLVGWKR